MATSTMNTSVTGHGVDLGEALTQYAHERVAHHLGKHISAAQSSKVVVSYSGKYFKTDCSVTLADGSAFFASSDNNIKEAKISVDKALETLEKQLRRQLRKAKDHHSE